MTLVLLTACSKKEVFEDVEAPLLIAVELTVTEKVEVNETVVMEAVVTQGVEKVEDASEVVFEVWEEGKKTESEMIESANEKEGLYRAETSFDHDGIFHIQVHVTARDMHVMPKREVTVGDGEVYEVADEYEYHTEGFSMNFIEPENIAANKETELTLHLELDENPMENARVRYEIWRESDPDNHDWINVDESSPGEYIVSYTFESVDTYQIQIHVEDDASLHEHRVYEVDVGK